MDTRKAVWYSIVRYSSDDIRGETINVGLIMHSLDESGKLKYFILEDTSPKIKSISYGRSCSSTYKSYRDILSYYLQESSCNLEGEVGNTIIGSCYSKDFLEKVHYHYEGKKLSLSKPSFALTKNLDMLYETLFETYVGKKYLPSKSSVKTSKKYIKDLFEERHLLNVKVKSDIEVHPVDKLDILKFKVDFGFKNGVWNYIQAIPSLKESREASEWYAKSKFIIDTLKTEDCTSKIHLLYRNSDIIKDDEANLMIDHLANSYEKVTKLNLDEFEKVESFCKYIEEEAEVIAS